MVVQPNDGDRLDLGGNVNAHWTFTNQWSTGMGFNAGARTFDASDEQDFSDGLDRNLRPAYRIARGWMALRDGRTLPGASG